jgi:hypothetical protein
MLLLRSSLSVCVRDESPEDSSIQIRHRWDTVTCERTSRCVQIETSNTCSVPLSSNSAFVYFEISLCFQVSLLELIEFPMEFCEWIRRLFFLIRSSFTLIRVSRFYFILLIISQSVGLLGRVTGPSQGHYLNTGQHKHRKTHTHTKHPCLEWNSNTRSRLPSERRQFMP